MEISEDCQTKNFVQSIRNNQRDAGPNSHNQLDLEKRTSPAFKDVQNSEKSDDICSICGQKFRREAIICGIKYSFNVMCKCEQEKQDKEKKQQEMLDKLRRIEKLKSLSLLGERYKNVTFENTQTGVSTSFDVAFNRCKKYCEVYEQVLKNGYEIYLFGDKGVGKTHLTACMANYLISKCVPVLFTNLFEISKSIKSTFNRESNQTEQDLIQKFSNIEILFFDDLGTEIFTKSSGETWLQSLLFDLINKRYNNRKATIFSSNYSLNSLINERSIMEKTVDRISEMTNGAVIKITGKSLRGLSKNNNLF